MAVTVLARGICGVTTTFSVVNGVMLHGFSFPNVARLVSVNFVDPTSRNLFGANGQVDLPPVSGPGIMRTTGRK